MRYALLVIGDGRDRLKVETLDSFAAACDVEPAYHVEVDDRRHELGFCGAIQEGWRQLSRLAGSFDYVFHLEEDWRFDRLFSVREMATVLDHSVSIAQVALRRNPVASAEIKAGGLVELWPEEYHDRGFVLGAEHGRDRVSYFLEHRLYFTTNPSLYRADLITRPWPNGPGCEETFGRGLIDDGYTFASWGARDSGHWITHTGNRTGTGY